MAFHFVIFQTVSNEAMSRTRKQAYHLPVFCRGAMQTKLLCCGRNMDGCDETVQQREKQEKDRDLYVGRHDTLKRAWPTAAAVVRVH